MPAVRQSMRKIREVLRLHHECGLSKRQIAPIVGIGTTTVFDYLARAGQAGLSWPLPAGLGDEELERLLFPSAARQSAEPPVQPDWPSIHRERRRKGVTLRLLWEEYRATAPQGYGYSQFCELYRRWTGRLSPSMRQQHIAGERLFVDFAGQTVEVIDPLSGEITDAQIFIAALGASSYTYAQAVASQSLPDWICGHVEAFAYFGGVPAQLVCDNLKAGVSKPCRWEPGLNPTYREMAEHYQTAIVPARVRKPRDKAKVEVAVQVVERWILARLRDRQFFSLAELNQAIAELLEDLNSRVMWIRRIRAKPSGESRRELFERLDKPALLALPETPYEYAEWRIARVGIDYHVEVQKHFYSVPYRLLRQRVEVRIAAQTVEIFHKGKRVALHRRERRPNRHTTIAEHMPSRHRRFADWTHERVLREAEATGPNCQALVEIIFRERKHPEQGFRSCVGILRLAKTFGPERLEAACERALEIGGRSYSSINSILKNRLDRRAKPEPAAEQAPTSHGNIRGPDYYH